jgi:hypothetical protein
MDRTARSRIQPPRGAALSEDRANEQQQDVETHTIKVRFEEDES